MLLLLVYLLGMVNGYFKSIVLKNIFKNILWKKKKVTSFLYIEFFYISHENSIKTFLKLFINKCPNGAR